MKIIDNIPFYPQKWDLDDWEKLGFKDKEDAQYWQDSSCGVLCLKMIVDYFRIKNNQEISPKISDFVKKGEKIGAYEHSIGWKHSGLVKLAEEFGLKGEFKDKQTHEKLVDAIDKGKIPIISVKWAFEKGRKSLKELILFWRKYGSHLILVTGYKKDGDKITGFYVHHTSTSKEYNWKNKFVPIDKFNVGYTQRCIYIYE